MLRDGGVVHNRIDLAKRSGKWEVVGYKIEAGTTAADQP